MSVRIRIPVAVFVLVALAQPATAQSAPPVADILVGYSILPANGDDFPRGTSHGVQLAGTAHLTRWFGLVADLAVHSSTRRDLGPGFEGLVAKTTVREYLVGPRFTARLDRADVFVHGLFGVSTGDAGPDFEGFSDSGLTFGGGGGVDVHVHRRFSVRVSYDLIGSFADIVEANTRFGLGLVTRFNRESSQ